MMHGPEAGPNHYVTVLVQKMEEPYEIRKYDQ